MLQPCNNRVRVLVALSQNSTGGWREKAGREHHETMLPPAVTFPLSKARNPVMVCCSFGNGTAVKQDTTWRWTDAVGNEGMPLKAWGTGAPLNHDKSTEIKDLVFSIVHATRLDAPTSGLSWSFLVCWLALMLKCLFCIYGFHRVLNKW